MQVISISVYSRISRNNTDGHYTTTVAFFIQGLWAKSKVILFFCLLVLHISNTEVFNVFDVWSYNLSSERRMLLVFHAYSSNFKSPNKQCVHSSDYVL